MDNCVAIVARVKGFVTFAHLDSSQSRATFEGTSLNFCDGIRNCHRSQTAATGEGIEANLCDGVAYSDALQSRATFEGIIANLRD